MTTRTIAAIETATNEMVGSFKIKNILPTRNLKQIDPFLLLHHLQPVVIKPGAEGRIPPHPHAGFEVATYLLQGEFFHRDSKGHDQVAKAGDINWMTSGSGITHSEGPTEAFAQRGDGIAELMQIWINLPAAQKKQEASFRHYDAAGFPVIEDDERWIKVLLGELEGKTSPIITQTPMFLYHIKINKGKQLILPVAENHSAGIYLLSGQIKSLNERAKAGDLLNFEFNGNQISVSATENTELLLFGGLPIKEKVVSYGPFVMNSLEEIQQAYSAFQKGEMGVLEY